ncbi:hypothetical protein HPB51_005929 [Rhipicephalus microplus]|uniref:Uncharacterized protein n=1 Tax=Rhipicephalus microplus TaxID=6941 RepID=A0A9J6E6P9_RHIMP|nr:hypothetical protein HPB51_005929 [Rhipicephalus microplus]
MDFMASQVNEDYKPSPKGSRNIVSANRKSALTTRPRSELITVGIQLPPGTLTPKLPLYDLLSTIIAATNDSPKNSAEVTLQAKPAQSLVFLKTHSPLTAHLLLSRRRLELNEVLRRSRRLAGIPPDNISMNDDTAISLSYYAAASTSATDTAQGGRRPRQPDYWAPEP